MYLHIYTPGVFQDQFYEYMFQQAVNMESRQLLDNKSKFVLIHSSSGFKHALKGQWWLGPHHKYTSSATLTPLPLVQMYIYIYKYKSFFNVYDIYVEKR